MLAREHLFDLLEHFESMLAFWSLNWTLNELLDLLPCHWWWGLHHRIVIGGLIAPFARLVSVEMITNDRVAGLERLNLAGFEQRKLFRVDVGCICWIYPGNRLMPLLNVDCTSLLNQANLYFLPGDEDLA